MSERLQRDRQPGFSATPQHDCGLQAVIGSVDERRHLEQFRALEHAHERLESVVAAKAVAGVVGAADDDAAAFVAARDQRAKLRCGGIALSETGAPAFVPALATCWPRNA